MTRLLVSVRNCDEARAALMGGADLIDVKEPARGALGAASLDTIRQVVAEVDGRVPVSAALGELIDADKNSLSDFPEALAFAKLGLAGCGSMPDWRQVWRQCLSALPGSVAPVAVVYADYQHIDAPAPGEIIAAAAELGCPIVLLDTGDKSRGSLLDHLRIEELAELIAAVRRTGLGVVLAGSLQSESIRRVLPLEPDYIAVRGAVCAGPRTAAVSLERVRALASLLHISFSRAP